MLYVNDMVHISFTTVSRQKTVCNIFLFFRFKTHTVMSFDRYGYGGKHILL